MEFPRSNIIRELGKTITLRTMFEKEEDKFIRFDNKKRQTSELEYRIPEHQRFPQWNKENKIKLIDTVIKDYTMSSLIVSQKYDIDNHCVYYDIEDGQTRLSYLQDFVNGVFSYVLNGEEYYFKEFSDTAKEKFLSYTLSIEVIKKKPGVSEKEYDYEIEEIFERLQGGTPLNNDDKFWNRKDSPMVKLAIELFKNKKLKKYFSINKFDPKNGHRKKLSNICGLIGSILYESYTPSFKLQKDNIDTNIENSHKKLVDEFVDYYIDILDSCYTIIPKSKEQYLKFYSNAKLMCVIICDYNDRDYENIEYKKNMWIYVINKFRMNEDLLNGSCTIWNGLKNSEKQNTNQKEHIKIRVDRIRDFYNPSTRYEICKKNAILDLDKLDEDYIDGDYSDINEENSNIVAELMNNDED